MTLSPGSRESIEEAARIIRAGGLVAFPTETVYGLGADALNPVAVSRIFEAKNRPFFDPLIVHIAHASAMDDLCREVPDSARALAKIFWPGPLTMVLKKNSRVPDIVTAGLDTVALRMPSHGIALDLIAASATPIAAPSANPFGYISPTRAEHVLRQLGDRVDMILDGGDCSVGVESTIVEFGPQCVRLLRPGGTAREDIEAIVGPLDEGASGDDRPRSPGLLPFHYSPSTPLRLVKDFSGLDLSSERTGFVFFQRGDARDESPRFAFLSEAGDLHEAAANLFSALHRLDGLGLSIIYAQEVPLRGLGLAIMDRLVRASKKGQGG
jgi:L-threonylcarbamoyladenylate synthase